MLKSLLITSTEIYSFIDSDQHWMYFIILNVREISLNANTNNTKATAIRVDNNGPCICKTHIYSSKLMWTRVPELEHLICRSCENIHEYIYCLCIFCCIEILLHFTKPIKWSAVEYIAFRSVLNYSCMSNNNYMHFLAIYHIGNVCVLLINMLLILDKR